MYFAEHDHHSRKNTLFVFTFPILQFRVSGNNLTSVCKLIFKVSRNEKNDPQFLKGDILGKYSELFIFKLDMEDRENRGSVRLTCLSWVTCSMLIMKISLRMFLKSGQFRYHLLWWYNIYFVRFNFDFT